MQIIRRKIKKARRYLRYTFLYRIWQNLNEYHFFSGQVRERPRHFLDVVWTSFFYKFISTLNLFRHKSFIRFFLLPVFILFLIFDIVVLRNWVIDAPLDAKVSEDRKEYMKGWNRYIPIIALETFFLIYRPFWRVFSNTHLLFSNLYVCFWLFQLVYVNPVKYFFKEVFYFLYALTGKVILSIGRSGPFILSRLALGRVFFQFPRWLMFSFFCFTTDMFHQAVRLFFVVPARLLFQIIPFLFFFFTHFKPIVCLAYATHSFFELLPGILRMYKSYMRRWLVLNAILVKFELLILSGFYFFLFYCTYIFA